MTVYVDNLTGGGAWRSVRGSEPGAWSAVHLPFQILGPLIINAGGRQLVISAFRQQAIMALLLLEANHVVPIERLAESIWGSQPPPTVRRQVQICVSVLRKSLRNVGAPGMIATHPPGYIFTVGADSLDLLQFDRFAVAGRVAAAAGQTSDAVEAWQAALALWNGVPAEGIDSPLIRAAGILLTERRLALLEDCVELELQLGRSTDAVGELMAVINENPFRERLREQLMRALYFSGRLPDALAVYRQGRRLMVDELGIEPSTELRYLEQQMLTGEYLTPIVYVMGRRGDLAPPLNLREAFSPTSPDGDVQSWIWLVIDCAATVGRLAASEGPGYQIRTRAAGSSHSSSVALTPNAV